MGQEDDEEHGSIFKPVAANWTLVPSAMNFLPQFVLHDYPYIPNIK